ncbi:YhcH/YjgK/YiaL family protein [Paenibacillus fonticola]|uniref:YhcH/YjgK/YiaL family protein n=1 Tax=Paenibacillus fonticola TaxID=379896 RepID=UPI00036461CC|nr:YhcH/YjgK/YiaL family protein [Paenibacillus fonticola]
MILGSLATWKDNQRFDHKVIAEAIEAIQSIVSNPPSPGRVEIRGDEIYVSVMELEAKPLEEQVAEKHEAYVDVHYLIEGEEIIGWAPLGEGEEPVKPYDQEGDYALYPPSKDEVLLTLKPGMFAVFYPNDIHRPAMGVQPLTIKKLVVKIHVDLFKS